MELSLVRMEGAVDGSLVATESVCEKTGNAPYGGHADASEVVNLSVGQPLLQIFDDLPAIYERLQFCRRTEILEEVPAFIDGFETA